MYVLISAHVGGGQIVEISGDGYSHIFRQFTSVQLDPKNLVKLAASEVIGTHRLLQILHLLTYLHLHVSQK